MDKNIKLSIKYDPNTGKNHINNFKLIKKIGQGQFGKVILATDLKNNEKVAIKCINRIDKTKLLTKNYVSQSIKIEREVKIMQKLHHKNIVQLYQVINDPKYDKILLILEYCSNGEINWKTSRDLKTISKMMRDITLGLEYLHLNKIIHRDIKPSNLLLDSSNNVKISDFGVSLVMTDNETDSIELGKTLGTPAFFAPELCQFNRKHDPTMRNKTTKNVRIDSKIDIWSLGVTLYCIVFNELPFNGNSEYELFSNIINDSYHIPNMNNKDYERYPKQFENVKLLVKKLLYKNPEKRISIYEIKSNAFLTSDLSTKEVKTFQNFNKKLIDDSFGNKFRNMFKKKDSKEEHKDEVNIDSHHVNDILDNYLNSSDSEDDSDFDSDSEDYFNNSNELGDSSDIGDYRKELNQFKPPNFNFNKSKLLSSNSSLNLNSYLNDDNLSLSINMYNELSRSSTRNTSSTSYRIDKDIIDKINHSKSNSESSTKSQSSENNTKRKTPLSNSTESPESQNSTLSSIEDPNETIVIGEETIQDNETNHDIPTQPRTICDYLDELEK